MSTSQTLPDVQVIQTPQGKRVYGPDPGPSIKELRRSRRYLARLSTLHSQDQVQPSPASPPPPPPPPPSSPVAKRMLIFDSP